MNPGWGDHFQSLKVRSFVYGQIVPLLKAHSERMNILSIAMKFPLPTVEIELVKHGYSLIWHAMPAAAFTSGKSAWQKQKGKH